MKVGGQPIQLGKGRSGQIERHQPGRGSAESLPVFIILLTYRSSFTSYLNISVVKCVVLKSFVGSPYNLTMWLRVVAIVGP